MSNHAKPTGRPSLFSQELADDICAQLSEGVSLRTVCKADDMPCTATVCNWLKTNQGFLEQYTRAKEESADVAVEDILDIADNTTEDANSRRVRIDARKWIASKLKPKVYGDRLALGGASDMPAIKLALTNLDAGL